MKLLRFKGAGIHGYMSFDVRFKQDLTFLTGINGSGKTTVLNAIVSLISPNLKYLADLNFIVISVELENFGRVSTIECRKSELFIELSVDTLDNLFRFRKFERTPDLPAGREAEFEYEYYREQTNKKDQVLAYIGDLPTPMFLGLDRRSRLSEEPARIRAGSSYYARSGRNVFGAMSTASLQEAAHMAETRYRDALIAVGGYGETLLREMLLKLLVVEPSAHFGAISKPNASDVLELKALRQDVDELPKILKLPAKDVRHSLVPFLDLMDRLIRQIPRDLDIDKELSQKPLDSKVFDALLSWSSNFSQLKRIRTISDIVTTFNLRQRDMTEPTDRYLHLLNGFLGDSGKRVLFDETGYLSFSIAGNQGMTRSLGLLSSGEAQIFVILSHLAFNPSAQSANVFIIDEPELSLHVQWQEIFVDSVHSANPSIQYIMATHSPSIIMARTGKCVDLSKRAVRRNG